MRPPETQRAGRHITLNRSDHLHAPARVFGAKRLQVSIEAAVANESRERELSEILGVRIQPLFDDRDLIDDRRCGREPAEPQARGEHLREAVQVDHQILGVQLVQ